jgi:putative heme-binding domain-containing protein
MQDLLFELQRAGTVAASLLCMTLAPDGSLLVGSEQSGVMRVSDADGDGFFETTDVLAPDFRDVQGLLAEDDAIYVVGRRGTRDATERGLWRLEQDGANPRLLVPFSNGDEHGPHGVVRGPDGALHMAYGDLSRPLSSPATPLPLEPPPLLPPLDDPSGYAARAAWPYGGVLRVDDETGAWTQYSHGMRNPYDLAFDDEGELFTVDADMEWDLGWCGYRPVRACLVVEGGDHGWRTGSDPLPAWFPDLVPPIAVLDRSSPTGILHSDALSWPAALRDTLVVGDWLRGRVFGVALTPDGSGWTGAGRVLYQSEVPLPVTDLIADAGGELLLCTGGRGQRGGLFRLSYRGNPDDSPVPPRDPQAAAARAERRALEDPTSAAPELQELYAPTDDRWLARARLARVTALPSPKHSAPELEQDGARIRSWIARISRGDSKRGVRRISPILEAPAGIRRAEALRALELAVASGMRIDADDHAQLLEFAREVMANDDPTLGDSAARLLAALAPPGSAGALLAELDRAESRHTALQRARCLAALAPDMNLSERAQYLRFCAEASGWTGGSSLHGWIQALYDEAIDGADEAELAQLAEQGALDARGIATAIARRPAAAADLLPVLRARFARLTESAEPALAAARRRDVLRALGSEPDPVLAPWLREVVNDEPPVARAAMVLIAACGLAEDEALCLKGLIAGSYEVREACSEYWLRRPPVEFDAETARALLDAAGRRGARNGRSMLAVLAHWTDRPSPALDAEGWALTLEEWHAWFAARFPDFEPPAPSPDRGPQWTHEDQLGFLERSAARTGSATRGAGVFERAGCGACHALGGRGADGSGYGPDLDGVGMRLDTLGLLNAIADPSRDVPERWGAVRAVLDDGSLLEGRLLREDANEVVLLSPLGLERAIDRKRLEALEATDRSPMPDGLLDGMSLEDLKDLLAFLRADGALDADRVDEPQWLPLLEGKQLARWTGDGELWSFGRGVLKGVADQLDHNEYLIYESAWNDFELELDVCAPRANTGLQFRSTVTEGASDPVGYQADIGQRYWGSLYATDGRGLLAEPDAELRRATIRPDGWNHLHLRVEGDRVQIEINGTPLIDVQDDAHASGQLALQLHQKMDMRAWFANLRVRPLR